jgi:hypothetical protein
MALSTVAFAADAVGTTAKVDEKTLTVTVTEADANEQVALYIVAESETASTSDTPLFIDQKGADTNGDATFTAKFDGTVDAVHVFAGYGKFATANNRAADLGAVTLKEAITAITVTKVDVDSVKGVKAESDLGDAYAFSFTATAPENVYATNMVWAISYTDGNGNSDTVYSESVDVSGYLIGAGMDGAITLGVAFSNGSVARELAAVTINSVDAIFLFNDADKTVKTTGDKNFSGDYVQK